MKDKYFDRPQKFDAEDEAFFAKHFGQRNDGSESSEQTVSKKTRSGKTVSGSRATRPVDTAPTAQPRPSQIHKEHEANRPGTVSQREAQTASEWRRTSQQTAPADPRRTSASSARSGARSGSDSVSRPASAATAERPTQPRKKISPEEAQRLAAERRRQRAREQAAQRTNANVQRPATERPVTGNPSARNSAPRKGSTPHSAAPPQPVKKRRRRKRRHWLLWLLVLLIAISVLTVALGRQPIRHTEGAGARTDGISTFVLAGTDADGERTDTIMLVSINQNDHTTSIMSIPRDTYVDAPYSVPKINSAYGYAGGRKKGMEELLQRISNIIGFMPDGYILVDLNDFVTVVNFMGGVKFDVPMDMDYDDPTQNLSIHLKAGEQHLSGREAIQLVRFRSGYADADLGRMSVQRDFMEAALKQWTSPLKIWRVPFLTVFIATQIRTDMSLSNLGWIGRVGLMNKIHAMRTDLLPGEPQYIGSGSYYVADEGQTRSLMKQVYSPYRG